MIKLFLKESQFEILGRSLYESLCEKKIKLELTDHIDTQSEDLYIITGAEFLDVFPKNYIVIQTIATSDLTISKGIESYWIDNQYINTLKNAKLIWDISLANINTWNTFYNFKHTHHLSFGYTSCQVSNVNQLMNIDALKGIENLMSAPKQDNNIIPKEFILLSNLRSENFIRQHSKNFVFLLKERWESYSLIASAKLTNTPFIILSDYENTYPDIPFCTILRYNNIQCIVEKSRDQKINNYLKEIGCHLVNPIRLNQNLNETIRDIYKNIKNTKPKMISLTNNLDLPHILSEYVKTDNSIDTSSDDKKRTKKKEKK